MLNVLITDDDRNLCECLLRLIPWEEIGCQKPYVTYNGMEAWDFLNENKIDILISDLKMPVMGGVDLSKRIRDANLDIEIIFLSAYEDFETARIALQYNVKDYVLKPVTRQCLSDIELIVREIVNSKQQKKAVNRLLSSDFKKEMFDALCHNDSVFIHNSFDQLKKLQNTDIFNVCVWFLHILYDYKCTLDGTNDRKMLDSIYKKWHNGLLGIGGAKEQIDYVESLYQNEISTEILDSETERIVHRVKEIVEDNYFKQECNVSWIADRLHMTSAYIGRIFGSYYGIGLMEYITERRIKRARVLLETEEYSVAEVAQAVGYAGANYFSKIFHNKTGMTPLEYRRSKENVRGNYKE